MSTVTTTAYMPDGRPAPYLMTKDEACVFLRITDTATRFPGDTLDRIRETYGLRAVQVGKAVRFRLPDLIDTLERMMEENPR